MTRLRIPLAIAAFAAALGLSCFSVPESERTELVVFAAASLRDVGLDLAKAFEAENEATVVFNFGGSNTLAQQILAAPRGQIFLSADRTWVDVLEQRGVVRADTRRQVFSNRLVVVASANSHSLEPLSSLADLGHRDFSGLVLADPDAVPAGRYARAALEATATSETTLWQRLASALVPTADVRAALALVESAPDLVGIVYATDADSSPRARVLYEIEPIEGLPVAYWVVAVEGAPTELSRRFISFLVGPVAQQIVASHGFIPFGRP